MKKCRLCHLAKPLRKSHIIPKFINKYLKETSLTGYLRGTPNINKRMQDGLKVELLCESCERKFSVWEKQFVENIFLPHNYLLGTDKELVKIEYDSSLISFIISLFWRVLVSTNIAQDVAPVSKIIIQNLEKAWEEFLNDKYINLEECEFHLITLDNIDIQYVDQFPVYFNIYLLRLWECRVYETDKSLGIYIKLPGMLLLCSLAPKKLQGFIETKVYKEGQMQFNNQVVKNEMVSILLLARSIALEEEISTMAPLEYKKIGDAIAINILKRY